MVQINGTVTGSYPNAQLNMMINPNETYESLWDTLPSELHNEIFRMEHKANLSKVLKGIIPVVTDDEKNSHTIKFEKKLIRYYFCGHGDCTECLYSDHFNWNNGDVDRKVNMRNNIESDNKLCNDVMYFRNKNSEFRNVLFY